MSQSLHNAKLLIQIDNLPNQYLSAGHTLRINATDISSLNIAHFGGNATAGAHQNVQVTRHGTNMQLVYADGTLVVVQGYYPAQASLTTADLMLSITVEGLTPEETLQLSSDPAINALKDTQSIDLNVAYLPTNHVLAQLLAEVSDATLLEAVEPAAAPLVSLGGLGGLAGVALAAAGGGGSPTAPVLMSTFTGMFVAGPVTQANGITVTAYLQDGSKYATTLNNDGSFSVSIPRDYKGVVLLRLVDTKTGVDYLDEATNKEVDIGADMRMAMVADGSASYTVAINAVTEIAVQKMGLSSGDEGSSSVDIGTLDEQKVAQTNEEVGSAFGLSGIDIASQIPVAVNDEGYADASQNAQHVGNVLAAISGIEVFANASKDSGTDTITTMVVLQELGKLITSGVPNSTMAFLLTKGAHTVDKAVGISHNVSDGLPEVFSAPYAFIASSNHSNGDFEIVIGFSETVVGFDQSDVIIDGGKITSVTQSGNDYFLKVQLTSGVQEGVLTVGVSAGAAHSTDQVDNLGALPYNYTYDTKNPAAPIITVADLDNGSTQLGWITFAGVEAGAELFVDVKDGNGFVKQAAHQVRLTAGTHSTDTVSAYQVDAAGNTGATQYLDQAIQVLPTTGVLRLYEDRGPRDDDGASKNGWIEVQGLEYQAGWEYSVDRGINWATGQVGHPYFETPVGVYAAGDMQVRHMVGEQTYHVAHNEELIRIDSTAPEAISVVLPDFSNGTSATGLFQIQGLEEGAAWYLSFDGGSHYLQGAAEQTQGYIGAGFNMQANQMVVYQQDAAGNKGQATYLDYAIAVGNSTQNPATMKLKEMTGASATSNTRIEVTLRSDLETWEYTTDAGYSWHQGQGDGFDLISGDYPYGSVYMRQTDSTGHKYIVAALQEADFEVDYWSPRMGDIRIDDWDDNMSLSGVVTLPWVPSGETLYYSLDKGVSFNQVDVTQDLVLPSGDYANEQVQYYQQDEAGNISNVAKLYPLLVIGDSGQLLSLQADNGTLNDDWVSNDGTIFVGGLAEGVSWSYSLDGGKNYATGTDKSFVLGEGEYEMGDVLVWSSDADGNPVFHAANADTIIIDGIEPELLQVNLDGFNGVDTAAGKVEFTNLEEGGSWHASIDGGTGFTKTGTELHAFLPAGTYAAGQIHVYQMDAAGNKGETYIHGYPLTLLETQISDISVSTNDLVSMSGLSGNALAVAVKFTRPVNVSGEFTLEVLVNGQLVTLNYLATDTDNSLIFAAQLPAELGVLAVVTLPDSGLQIAAINGAFIEDVYAVALSNLSYVDANFSAQVDTGPRAINAAELESSQGVEFYSKADPDASLVLQWGDDPDTRTDVFQADVNGDWNYSYYANDSYYGDELPTFAGGATVRLLQVNPDAGAGITYTELASQEIQVDLEGPTVTGVSFTVKDSDGNLTAQPTPGAVIDVVLTFSEAIGDYFSATHVQVDGGQVSGFAGTDEQRSFTITVDAGMSAPLLGQLYIAPNTISDLAGNFKTSDTYFNLPIAVNDMQPLVPLSSSLEARAGSTDALMLLVPEIDLSNGWRVKVEGLATGDSLVRFGDAVGIQDENGALILTYAELDLLQWQPSKDNAGAGRLLVTYQMEYEDNWVDYSQARIVTNTHQWVAAHADTLVEDVNNITQYQEAWNIGLTGLSGHGVVTVVNENDAINPELSGFAPENLLAATQTDDEHSHADDVAMALAGSLSGTQAGVAYGAQIYSSYFQWYEKHDPNYSKGIDVANWSVGYNSNYIEDAWSFNNETYFGRDGLGTVVVVSASNDGIDTNTAQTLLTKSPGSIVVASVSIDGARESFSSRGETVHVSAPGTGGTSFAAPFVSGVAALMLEANPGLGFRDVQSILAYSAQLPTDTSSFSANSANTFNGSGLNYSAEYGFGVVNAFDSVRMAKDWLAMGQHALTQETMATTTTQSYWWYHGAHVEHERHDISAVSGAAAQVLFNVEQDVVLESIQLTFELDAKFMQDLTFYLTSPSGTVSDVSSVAVVDEYDGLLHLSSNRFWGESSNGEWRLTFEHSANVAVDASVENVAMSMYGQLNTQDTRYVYTDDFLTDVQGGDSAPLQWLSDNQGNADVILASALNVALEVDLSRHGFVSIEGQRQQFMPGTQIEGAMGGSVDDHLMGSTSYASVLRGNGGQDAFITYGNGSVVHGGDGADLILFASGDHVWGGAGADIFVVSELTYDLLGDAANNTDNRMANSVAHYINDFTYGVDQLMVIDFHGTASVVRFNELGTALSITQVLDPSYGDMLMNLDAHVKGPSLTDIQLSDTAITLSFDQAMWDEPGYSVVVGGQSVGNDTYTFTDDLKTMSFGVSSMQDSEIVTLSIVDPMYTELGKYWAFNTMVLATQGNDTVDLSSQSLSHAVYGAGGADTITGGSASDLIIVGGVLGGNALVGGEGADTFVWQHFDTAQGGVPAGAYTSGADSVSDFSFVGGDVLDISHILESFNVVDDLTNYVELLVSGDHINVNFDASGAGNFGSGYSIALTDLNLSFGIEDGTNLSLDYVITNGAVLV